MGADSDEVDAWIERNKNRRQVRKKRQSDDSDDSAQLPLIESLE